MKQVLKKSIIISFFVLLSGAILANGYKIKVKISDLQDSSIYLGYHFGSKQYLKDTIQLNENGEGIFTGKEKLPGGIYLIVLPGMKYFEMLLGNNQEFQVEAQSTDIINNLKFKNSQLNTGFNEYQRYMVKQQTAAKKLREQLKSLSEESDSTDIIQKELNKIDEGVKVFWDNAINKYPNTPLATVIKGMKSIEIPEFEIPESISNKDSAKWAISYDYNKTHYFDNIDFSDSTILRTPIFDSKLEYYFTKLLLQTPDSLIPATDNILTKSKANKEIFQTVLVFLINHYQKTKIMGLDKVFVHLAENYYLAGKASWADSTFLSKLEERVIKLKPNLIGNIAPDLKMETSTGEYVTLHEIDADYTILIFWEPDCGHCKKEMPKLKELYKKYRKKSVEIMAVFTQFERDKWLKYIEENELDWINAYDPYHQTNFRNLYDVIGTPSVFMLNKDKKIIAKKINAETLEEMLGHFFEEEN